MEEMIKKIRKTFATPGVGLIMLIVVPVIVVLIIVIVYLVVSPSEIMEPGIIINNFEEVLPDVPNGTRKRIEERLYATVEESGIKDVPEEGAMIRLGSNDGFALQGTFHVGDFIVDIGAVQQSYIVKYFYGYMVGENETEPSASATLYCIEDPSQMIYADFDCKANRDYTRPDPVQYVLPYETDSYALTYTYSLTSASGYAVVVTYNPPEEVYLEGRLEQFENESMGEIYSYLTGAGVNPDDYEFIYKYKIVE